MLSRDLLLKKIVVICLVTLLISSAVCLSAYYLVLDLLPPQQLTILKQQLVITIITITLITGTITSTYHYYNSQLKGTTNTANTTIGQRPHPALDNSIHILVVDDNPANRLIITDFLKIEDIKTRQAKNGEEAIRLFQEHEFNMVFMDIEMSDTDGLEATQIIRALEKTLHKSRTPIIGVSAYSENEKRHQSLLAGFDDYMIKPINKADINDSLQRWCDVDNNIGSTTQEIESVGKPQRTKPVKPLITDCESIAKVVDIQQSLSYSHNNHELAKDMLKLLITMIHQEKNALIEH